MAANATAHRASTWVRSCRRFNGRRLPWSCRRTAGSAATRVPFRRRAVAMPRSCPRPSSTGLPGRRLQRHLEPRPARAAGDAAELGALPASPTETTHSPAAAARGAPPGRLEGALTLHAEQHQAQRGQPLQQAGGPPRAGDLDQRRVPGQQIVDGEHLTVGPHQDTRPRGSGLHPDPGPSPGLGGAAERARGGRARGGRAVEEPDRQGQAGEEGAQCLRASASSRRHSPLEEVKVKRTCAAWSRAPSPSFTGGVLLQPGSLQPGAVGRAHVPHRPAPRRRGGRPGGAGRWSPPRSGGRSSGSGPG